MQFINQNRNNNIGQLDKYISNRNYNVQKCDAKKIILIKTLLVTYGNGANKKITKQIATNIQWHWNFPKAIVKINNTKYKVIFKIKAIYFPSLNKNLILKNKDQKIFFIRIENEVNQIGVSVMDGICSNTGFFKVQNVGYKGSSTEAHEYGHALGLVPNTPDGHPTDLDIRGKGVPGIMYPRGSWVDAKYQWNPKVVAGEAGGTLMPDFRRVRQEDIDMLQLQNKNWNAKGKIRLGALSSKFHEADFKII